MAEATRTVTINRPVDAVFAFVADGETAPRWRAGVLDIKRLSGDGLGVGTRYAQGVRGPMGRRVAADYEVTAFEPNRRIEFLTIAGPVRPRGRYDLQPAGDGTHITFSLEAQLTGIRALLMGGMVQRTMDAEVQALDRLKGVLEA